jgi:AcrR family transcriptional regulator
VKKLEWVRAPQQTRSQKTLDRILDAAEKLLVKKTFEEISVAEIVKKARSSIGSFYARFADKDALLLVLQARFYTESLLTAQAALDPKNWEKVPLSTIIPSVVTFMCEAYVERIGLRRALLARMVTDERFRRPATDLSREVCTLITTLAQTRRREIQHEDIALAVDVCHRIVFSVLDQHYTFAGGSPTGRRMDMQTMARELSTACSAYLGLASAGPSV